MQQLIYPLFGCTALAAALFLWLWQKAQAKAHRLEVQLASSGGLADLQAELDEAEEALTAARAEIIGLNKDREKDAALMAQKEEALKAKQEDFEKLREESLQAARASVLKAGAEVSSKLLEDFKREAAGTKKEQEHITSTAQQKFMEQFTQLTNSVAQIQQLSQQNSQQMETTMRALTHPAGAGFMSEVGLENSLKNLGLEAGRDFMMQYHVRGEHGGDLRPDAVIFLPQDMVMVIDSKASKHMIDHAEKEGTPEESQAMQGFLTSMHQHIKTLAQKQYADEVTRILKAEGREAGLRFNVMYLPSDAAIEKLRKADPSIAEKCEKANLFMAGPASLQALFSLANQQISSAKRDANQQKIIDHVGELMGAFATALGHAEAVGKNLETAAKKFSAFAGSVNGRLLPKLRTMEKLGVGSAKNKPLPQAIKTYDVIDRDDYVTVDSDDEESTDNLNKLPLKSSA